MPPKSNWGHCNRIYSTVLLPKTFPRVRYYSLPWTAKGPHRTFYRRFSSRISPQIWYCPIHIYPPSLPPLWENDYLIRYISSTHLKLVFHISALSAGEYWFGFNQHAPVQPLTNVYHICICQTLGIREYTHTKLLSEKCNLELSSN